MQHLYKSSTKECTLELFHLQTNTSFRLPQNKSVISIGKPNEEIMPDIDVSCLPDEDIVSRLHVIISIEDNNYYLQDQGSSNGTYLNQKKLLPHTNYQLRLGDKIELGQGSKVTFIFQNKEPSLKKLVTYSNPTIMQNQDNNLKAKPNFVSAIDRFIGCVLIVAGILILAGNIRVGFFVRIPGVLLCLAGVIILSLGKKNRYWGWVLIAIGIGVILFTGHFFTSTNLLVLIVSSALLFAGHQLLTTGKLLNRSLSSLMSIFKSK